MTEATFSTAASLMRHCPADTGEPSRGEIMPSGRARVVMVATLVAIGLALLCEAAPTVRPGPEGAGTCAMTAMGDVVSCP